MEEMQKKLDQTRAEFHRAVEAKNKAEQDAAWANYMTVLFQAQAYNKIHGTLSKAKASRNTGNRLINQWPLATNSPDS